MAGQIRRFISDWEISNDISLPKSFWHEDRRWHLFQSGLTFNENKGMLSFARKIMSGYTDGDVLTVVYSYIVPASTPPYKYPKGISLERRKISHPSKYGYFLVDNIHAFYMEHTREMGKTRALRALPSPYDNFGERVISEGMKIAVGCGCHG